MVNNTFLKGAYWNKYVSEAFDLEYVIISFEDIYESYSWMFRGFSAFHYLFF